MGQTIRTADHPARRNDRIYRTPIDSSADTTNLSPNETCAIGRRGGGASYHPLRTEEKPVRRTTRLTRAMIGRAPTRWSRGGGSEEEEVDPDGGVGVGGGDRVRWLVRLFVPPATAGREEGRENHEMELRTSYRPAFLLPVNLGISYRLNGLWASSYRVCCDLRGGRRKRLRAGNLLSLRRVIWGPPYRRCSACVGWPAYVLPGWVKTRLHYLGLMGCLPF
jgi:hypothetical protein